MQSHTLITLSVAPAQEEGEGNRGGKRGEGRGEGEEGRGKRGGKRGGGRGEGEEKGCESFNIPHWVHTKYETLME